MDSYRNFLTDLFYLLLCSSLKFFRQRFFQNYFRYSSKIFPEALLYFFVSHKLILVELHKELFKKIIEGISKKTPGDFLEGFF